jgi:thiamine pyrophosphate-dependent acetolactate synthase large subunit-like protein
VHGRADPRQGHGFRARYSRSIRPRTHTYDSLIDRLLISGDSAPLFHISELETAVRKRLPIVVVVNSDAAWGMERPGFLQEFGPDSEVEVGWGAVRFDKIADGFGAYGEYVDRSEEIAPAVARALEAGRPALVQVAVDPMANALEAPDVGELLTWYAGSLY